MQHRAGSTQLCPGGLKLAGGIARVQADRGALPSQSVFLTGEEKGDDLAGEPADDDRFVAVLAHFLEHAGGYPPEEAARVARTMLPDILFYEPKRPASYPDNGRALTDDVMDVFLSILTNGKVTRDNVGPHKNQLAGFPYLGRRTSPDLRNWFPPRRRPHSAARREWARIDAPTLVTQEMLTTAGAMLAQEEDR